MQEDMKREYVKKLTDISWMSQCNEWTNLVCIISIRRIVETKNNKLDKISYYISKLDESAEKLMSIAREHWKIESMHWLLDVSFFENTCKFIRKYT